MCFESRVTYTAERIHAAAVYCSDGRFGEAFDDFLTHGLSLPRYDRVALPGGPGCMAGHPEARVAGQGVLDDLDFLVQAHDLERVVLIQHHGCAFYRQRLSTPADQIAELQLADLVRVASLIRHQTPRAKVEAYFADLRGDRVVFEAVPVD